MENQIVSIVSIARPHPLLLQSFKMEKLSTILPLLYTSMASGWPTNHYYHACFPIWRSCYGDCWLGRPWRDRFRLLKSLLQQHLHWTYSKVKTSMINSGKLSKETNPFFDYCTNFKLVCDQFSAIENLVNDASQLHWFLCGLGSLFKTLFTCIRYIL